MVRHQINNFDGTLLSHNSVRNAADNFVTQLFKRNKKRSNGTLTEDDLDKTLEYENHLIKQIKTYLNRLLLPTI